jgi:hypothetical protein
MNAVEKHIAFRGLTETKIVEIGKVKPTHKMLRCSAWHVAGLWMGLRRSDFFSDKLRLVDLINVSWSE